MGLDLWQKLGGGGSAIMKIMLPFRAEVLNMQHFYYFCIYSTVYPVHYRRLKNRFLLSLDDCSLSLLLFLCAFVTSWRVICSLVPKDLDQLCPCLLPRGKKKKGSFTDKCCSSSWHGHPQPESLFMQFFVCRRTWWFLLWSLIILDRFHRKSVLPECSKTNVPFFILFYFSPINWSLKRHLW